jgi:hypothetical protein
VRSNPATDTQRCHRRRYVVVRASETDTKEEPDQSPSSSSSSSSDVEEMKKKDDGAARAASRDTPAELSSSPPGGRGEEPPPPTAAAVASVAAGASGVGWWGKGKEKEEEEEEKPERVAPFVPAPPAPPAIEGDLRATAVVCEVLRMSFRDLVPVATLICVAGAAAQVLNLGGTFLLALLQVHDIEVIATLFLAVVQLWKLCCENMCKIAVMRNARDVDAGDAARWSRANPVNAWAAVAGAYEGYKHVLFIDARRCLSIAWNSVLTIPIPYLGLIKLLDYALCVPVFLFEGKVGAGCLKRSQELMYGSRLLLLRTAFYIVALFSIATGVVVGGFMVLCPTLPTLLLPPKVETTAAAAGEAAAAAAAWAQGAAAAVGEEAAAKAAAEMVTAATSGPTIGDAAAGIFSGSAFDRVWDIGTPAEKWATIALLSFAVAGSFAFTVVLRQLVYVFHREVSARWTPPPPPPPPEERKEGGGVRGLFRKMQFWKKKDESSSSTEDAKEGEGEEGKQEGSKGDSVGEPRPQLNPAPA